MPACAQRVHQCWDRKERPRDQRQQQHGNVIPEWLRMAEHVRGKTREIVFENEGAQEVGILELDQHIPWQRDAEKDHDAWPPKSCLPDGAKVAAKITENENDEPGEQWGYRAFGQCADGDEDVEIDKPKS